MHPKSASLAAALAFALAAARAAMAGGIPAVGLDEVEVTAKRIGLIGELTSASQGTVLGIQLETRPVLRPGEVLEVVPGLIVTQHSGDGKANQYFLRGFNLDHGTDFATRVEGLPVNMPTHAHGQGYSDINFLLPELVESVEYRKGTYYAEEGNFSAAGSVDIRYRRRLDQSLVSLGVGQDGFRRGLAAGSIEAGGGDLLVALDYSTNDGPWQLPQDFRKVNGLAKFTRGDRRNGFDVTAMGYDGRWHSTDQVPLRAIESGLIDRYGYIDPTDGGDSHRYSVSANLWRTSGDTRIHALAYGIDYGLDLISNFTYALDTERGDQFEQYDRRQIFGGHVGFDRPLTLGGLNGSLAGGLELRYDDIAPVALYRTEQRERYDTIRKDDVQQTSYSAYLSADLKWSDWLRTEVGLRADHFRFTVASDLAANSGSADDTIVSPKLGIILGPWADTEYFINVGRGFHSNDARGTTISVDPNDGVTPVDRVDPLVPALGGEIGFRSAVLPGLQVAGSLWTLKLDSELLFVGDGGTTEESGATRRSGLEIGLYYQPLDWLTVDADLAWTRARFAGDVGADDRIPGAVEQVTSVGVGINHPAGYFGGARLRHFGSAPLVEDNSQRSDPTTLLNLELGYRFTPQVSAMVTVFNVLDSRDNDITYYYESRLPGESAPVEDFHLHPVEPRTFRASVTVKF